MNLGIRYCPIHEGEYKSFNKHRKICQNCKNDFPFKTAGKQGKPFNRKELWEKEKKKQL